MRRSVEHYRLPAGISAGVGKNAALAHWLVPAPHPTPLPLSTGRGRDPRGAGGGEGGGGRAPHKKHTKSERNRPPATIRYAAARCAEGRCAMGMLVNGVWH